jgi:hypothetical protein
MPLWVRSNDWLGGTPRAWPDGRRWGTEPTTDRIGTVLSGKKATGDAGSTNWLGEPSGLRGPFTRPKAARPLARRRDTAATDAQTLTAAGFKNWLTQPIGLGASVTRPKAARQTPVAANAAPRGFGLGIEAKAQAVEVGDDDGEAPDATSDNHALMMPPNV